MQSSRNILLEWRNIQTGYNSESALAEFCFEVESEQVVALIGPNGAGKSTIMKTIFGLLPIWSGSLRLFNEDVRQHGSINALKLGMAYAPQSKRVFPTLTVKENISLGCIDTNASALTGQIDFALSVFPDLAKLLKKTAGNLSGGEQQLVNLGRCVARRPKLLLLDEPTLGLSPQMADHIMAFIKNGRAFGMTIILIEQRVKLALNIATKVMAIKLGRLAFSSTPAELNNHPSTLSELFL